MDTNKTNRLFRGKAFKTVVVMMLALAMMIPLCSCGSSTERKIQGTWYIQYEDIEITFRDGSWETNYSEYGTYTVDGDTIHLVGRDMFGGDIDLYCTYYKDGDYIDLYGHYLFRK